MKAPTIRVASLIGGLAALVLSVGCDTGFGQPCSLPNTPEFQLACNPSASGDADGGTVTITKSSCAVKDYAGCETRICLVYRGSSPFCSEACKGDSDCEGSAHCRPIIGDITDTDCAAEDESGFTPECYCVRGGDLDN